MSESYNSLLRLLYLVWYQGYVFFKKTRSLLPLALWMFVLYLCFDINYPPVYVMQGYLSTTMWFFFVMVWFGYLFFSGIDMIEEHLLILQINSRFLYSVSKILFLVVLSMALSIVGCIFPVIIELVFKIRGLTFIPNGINLTDFFGALALNIIIGTVGLSLAYIFQPNPSKSRNDFTVSTLIMFVILAFAKYQIFNLQGLSGYLLFVFTPIFEIIHLFYGKNEFVMEDVMLAAIYGGIYCLISVAVGYWLYNKRVYSPLIAQHKDE